MGVDSTICSFGYQIKLYTSLTMFFFCFILPPNVIGCGQAQQIIISHRGEFDTVSFILPFFASVLPKRSWVYTFFSPRKFYVDNLESKYGIMKIYMGREPFILGKKALRVSTLKHAPSSPSPQDKKDKIFAKLRSNRTTRNTLKPWK